MENKRLTIMLSILLGLEVIQVKVEGGRTRNIGIRVSEDELVFIKSKASELGLSLTDLVFEGIKKL